MISKKLSALGLLLLATNAGASGTVELKPECRAIFMAALKGDAAAIIRELRNGSDPNCRDGAGQTALMLAATNGSLAAVRPLLKAGADPNVQDRAGETALVFAAIQGRVDTIKALLRKGASLNLKDKNGMTALEAVQASTASPKAEVIRLLGGNPQSKGPGVQDSGSSFKEALRNSETPAKRAVVKESHE